MLLFIYIWLHVVNGTVPPVDPEGEVDFLPFLDLTTFPGVMELDNTQADATSEAINIPDGLIFGDEIATLAYVSFFLLLTTLCM